MNRLAHRSLHPFQILFDGISVFIHRGVVVDVEIANVIDVDNATADLRFEPPLTSFSPNKSYCLEFSTADAAGISENDSVRIESAAIIEVTIGNEGDGMPVIGTVENGVITQRLKSDFYMYKAGTSTA